MLIIKIKERISELPDGMTMEQLDKILYHNALAMARILALSIKKERKLKEESTLLKNSALIK